MVKKSQKMYTVVEIGWEYNDEYYARHDDDSGNPRYLFSTKEKAKAFAEKMNSEKVAKNSKSPYPMTDCDNEPISEFYEVAEVEFVE